MVEKDAPIKCINGFWQFQPNKKDMSYNVSFDKLNNRYNDVVYIHQLGIIKYSTKYKKLESICGKLKVKLVYLLKGTMNPCK